MWAITSKYLRFSLLKHLVLFGGVITILPACSSEEANSERMFSPVKVDSSIPTQIQELSKGLAAYPEEASWYLKRARLYLATNKVEEANKDLSIALENDASLGEAYFLKGRILSSREQYQEAMKMMMQAQAFNFYTPESEAVLAETYVGLKQYGKALNHSAKAIRLRPGEPKYYVLLAKSQAGTGDTARALYNLTRALRRDSLSLPAFREMAAIYTAQHRFPEAYPLVQTGLKKQPKDEFWWRQMGHILLNQRLTDTAMACFNRAVSLDPKQADSYIGLGQAWYKKRQYRIALDHFQKALGMGARLSDNNRWLLATCYEWTSQRPLAIPHYVFLSKKYPQNPRYSLALRRMRAPVRRRTVDTLSTTSDF